MSFDPLKHLLVGALALAAAACLPEKEEAETVECTESGILAEKGGFEYYVSCTSLCGRCYSLASDGLGCHDDADHPYCVCEDGSFVTMCWTADGSGEACEAQSCE